VGTMNPEEGDLRPQLLDRFALSVDIRGILEPRQRVQIMERNIAFETDPEAFREEWLPKEHELSEQIAKARKLVDHVRYSSRDLLAIADLTAKMQVDGHRADLVILKAARAHAAFEGRDAINPRDIALAAELALPHRVKTGPFRQSEMGITQLQEHIEQLKGASSEGDSSGEEQQEADSDSDQKKSLSPPESNLASNPLDPSP
jgi:Mg-chelatase subunit ChlI